MKNIKSRLVLSAAAVLLMLPSTSFAETECSTDTDCGEGFNCETWREPCPDVVCAADTECPDVSCEPTEHTQCVPAPPESCTTSADCGTDELCVTFTYETCAVDAGAPCAPGEDCDDSTSTEESCTTESESYCLPPYMAPCQVDSDCGAGFSCVEAESCACSGEGSTGTGSTRTDPDGSADAGGPDIGSTTDDNCTCSGTGDFYCELDEQHCTDDSDCAAGLVCDPLPWQADSGEAVTCAEGPDGQTQCEDAGTVDAEPQTYCQPEDLERWAGAAGDYHDESPAPGSPTGGGSDSDGRNLVSAEADRSTQAGGGAGSDSAGCSSTGHSDAPAGAALTAVFFGLLGLLRLRRRR